MNTGHFLGELTSWLLFRILIHLGWPVGVKRIFYCQDKLTNLSLSGPSGCRITVNDTRIIDSFHSFLVLAEGAVGCGRKYTVFSRKGPELELKRLTIHRSIEITICESEKELFGVVYKGKQGPI